MHLIFIFLFFVLWLLPITAATGGDEILFDLCLGERSGSKILFEPAITLRERAFDDLYYTGNADTEHYIAPSIDISISREDFEIQADAIWGIYRYTSANELDTVDERVSAAVNYRFDEYVRARMPVRFRQESLVRLNAEEFGVLTARGDLTNLEMSPEINILLSPFHRLRLDGAVERSEPSFSDFSNNLVFRLGGSWIFEASERANFKSDWHGEYLSSHVPGTYAEGNVGVFEIRVGGGYRITETITFNIIAGMRVSRACFDEPENQTKDVVFDPAVQTILRWQLQRLLMETSYLRDAYPDIYGEYVTRDLVVSDWRYQTSERSVAAATVTWRHLENQGYLRPLKTRMLRFAAEFKYRLTENHTAIVGITTIRDENLLAKNRRYQNRAFVTVELAWPKLF